MPARASRTPHRGAVGLGAAVLGLGLVAGASSGCNGDGTAPPPVVGRPGATVGYEPVVAPPDPPEPPEAVPAADSFAAIDDADAWIRATFTLGQAPARVILVDPDPAGADTIDIPSLDLTSDRPGPSATHPVDMVVQELQTAADRARGGDVIAVKPGEYRGFTLGEVPSAGDGQYVRFVALGPPGAVRITGPAPEDPNWMIHLRGAHHVTIEGFRFEGQSQPGASKPGPWAGIFLNGDFRNTGETTHHVAVVRVFAHNLKKWGLHSTDSHSVLIQDSAFMESGEQHGAYVSDGSDNYVIRRNVFQGNHQSGLQCNLDPIASLEELSGHPSMSSIGPFVGQRDWAESALARGDAIFGAGSYPDGRGENFLIEQNVISQNGKGGGGALNFATMNESRIRNNLLYDNLANGIVLWDDENPFDEEARQSPASEADARDPNKLPLFGSRDNRVHNNTVLMARPGRAALMIRNGSTGTVAYNNVLINDLGPGIEIWDTSVAGLDVGHTITSTVARLGRTDALTSVATHMPEDNETRLGVRQSQLAPWVRRAGNAPWIAKAGDWWQLAPNRPDFRPSPGSPLVGSGSAEHAPPFDLLGEKRTGVTIGAFAP